MKFKSSHGRIALALLLALLLTASLSVSAFAAPDGNEPTDPAAADGTPQEPAETPAEGDPEEPENPAGPADQPATQADDGEETDSEPLEPGTVEAIMIGETTIITDTVSYEGLRVGTTYTLNGTLYDFETKAPLEINGAQVTGTTSFVCEQADGTASVGFTLDTRGLAGKKVVVFEKLLEGDVQIAAHEDINDPDQTVQFIAPDVATSADGDEPGTKVVRIGSTVTVTDTITYTNLKPDVEYTATGTLMDKSNGQPIMNGEDPVTATGTFTPTASNGTTSVEFTFDATALGGKQGVVFEEISAGGIVIGAHKELNDADQTVKFEAPEITTSAVGDGGKKELTIGGTTTVTDTITYSNARPGQAFSISGVLMVRPDASAEGEPAAEPQQLLGRDGQPVTATAEGVVAESGTGTIDVTYTFDSLELSGKTVVVYEEMKMGETVVAEHKDINDDQQAVTFKDMEITTELVADGEAHTSPVGANIELIDHVHYTNLTPGLEYELRASLVDKDGNPITVGGNQIEIVPHKFTPTEADGTADVPITIDARSLDGKSVVAYEELYLNGIKLGEHKDASDEDQTVTFSTPKITTKASGAAADIVRIRPETPEVEQTDTHSAADVHAASAGRTAEDPVQASLDAVRQAVAGLTEATN